MTLILLRDGRCVDEKWWNWRRRLCWIEKWALLPPAYLRYKHRRPITQLPAQGSSKKIVEWIQSQGPGNLNQNQERRNRIPEHDAVQSNSWAITNVRNSRQKRPTIKSLRLPHEATCFQGTSLSLTWSSLASSEGSLPHRNSPRIIGTDVPDSLTHSKGYLTPQRVSLTQKNRFLSQKYHCRRRNYASRSGFAALFRS